VSDYFKRLERIWRAKINDAFGVFDRDGEPQVDPDDILRESGFDPGPGTGRPSAPPGGISPELRRAYANLELEPPSTLDEAKKAWRKLMTRYHPDRHQSDPKKTEVATQVAARLTDAYRQVREHLEGRG